MLKRITFLLLLLVMMSSADPRNNRTITVAAGTPVRISSSRLLVRKVFIQMLTVPGGSAGLGYVMAGIQGGRTPSASASSDLTAQLCAASTTAPGCSYSDQDMVGTAPIDLSQMWVDGAHTGDTIAVSWELR